MVDPGLAVAMSAPLRAKRGRTHSQMMGSDDRYNENPIYSGNQNTDAHEDDDDDDEHVMALEKDYVRRLEDKIASANLLELIEKEDIVRASKLLPRFLGQSLQLFLTDAQLETELTAPWLDKYGSKLAKRVFFNWSFLLQIRFRSDWLYKAHVPWSKPFCLYLLLVSPNN